MSIQDPTRDPAFKPNFLTTDALTVTVNSILTNNNEDKLDSIASSLPPFPPESDDVMEAEMEIEPNNNTLPALRDILPIGEDCGIQPLEIAKPKTKKRKKLEKEKAPSFANDGNEMSGGDGLRQGKPSSSDPLFGRDGLDLSSLMDANRYDRTSQGPYDVIIQTPEGSPSSIDPIAVGRLLYSISKKDIVEIKKTGFSKISIQLKSREAANNLISNPILKAKKYNAFIPLFRTTRKGIIRNVPLDLSDEEIYRGIDCSIAVSSVRRLNRRERGAEASALPGETQGSGLVPSKTISIVFKGQTLPRYLYLYMVRHPVEPFVSKTSLCYTCLRFGHLKSQCKGHPRCQHCGDGAHEDATQCPKKDGPPFCINCKGPHKATSFTCPEYVVQKKIRELAAYENISLIEARNRIKGNIIEAPNPIYNFSEYPSLSSTPPSTPFPLSFPASSTLPSSSSVPPSPLPPSSLYSQILNPNRKKLSTSAPLHISSPMPSPLLLHPQKKPPSSINPPLSSFPRSTPGTSSSNLFPSHNSLLISPNGRFPSSSDYGISSRHNIPPPTRVGGAGLLHLKPQKLT